jgi:hypothetical protein
MGRHQAIAQALQLHLTELKKASLHAFFIFFSQLNVMISKNLKCAINFSLSDYAQPRYTRQEAGITRHDLS